MSWVRISSPAPNFLKHNKVLHRKLDTHFLCAFLLVPQPVPLLSHDSRYWYHFMPGCIDLVVYRKRHMKECINNRFHWYHFMRFCNRWYHYMRYRIAIHWLIKPLHHLNSMVEWFWPASWRTGFTNAMTSVSLTPVTKLNQNRRTELLPICKLTYTPTRSIGCWGFFFKTP